MLEWILLLLLTTAGLRGYLRIAPTLNLIDRPNDRSLHVTPTVVGAGAVPMLLLVGVIALLSGIPNAFAIASLLLYAFGISEKEEPGVNIVVCASVLRSRSSRRIARVV